jgi:ABC-type multidrug transport system fused ATPase/permease subunit
VLLASRENLMGIRVVRAFGLEKKEKEEFSKKQGELTKAQRFVGDISSLLNPLSYLVINLGTAFLIWKGAIRVEHGILTQGAVVALYNYMAQILEELVKLANTIILLTKMIASGNRVQEVFEISPSQEYPQETSCEKEENLPFLVFDQVSFRYEKAGEDALKNISFTANKGEVIGIIGGTGSGKTSLVQLIGRFYDASSGQILLDGKDVRKYTKEDLRSKISMVPQKAVLF